MLYPKGIKYNKINHQIKEGKKGWRKEGNKKVKREGEWEGGWKEEENWFK